MTETQLKNQSLRAIKKSLVGCFCYHPSDKWVSGIPDIFILWKGRFAAIELKVGRNKPSPIQLTTLAKIEAAGGITAVCYNIEEVRSVINRMLSERVGNGPTPIYREV